MQCGEVYPDQVVAVKSKKGIIIIDSGISPTIARKYRQIIEKTFKTDKIIYVINTHNDFDHTNGNQVFADATIISHVNCPQAMTGFYNNIENFIQKERCLKKKKFYGFTIDSNN